MEVDKYNEKQGEDRRKRFRTLLAGKALRSKRQREQPPRGIFYWVGMFGLVGWSVAVLTIAGVMLGRWLDRTYPSSYSFTLMFLLIGVALGCLTAWYWLRQESQGE